MLACHALQRPGIHPAIFTIFTTGRRLAILQRHSDSFHLHVPLQPVQRHAGQRRTHLEPSESLCSRRLFHRRQDQRSQPSAAQSPDGQKSLAPSPHPSPDPAAPARVPARDRRRIASLRFDHPPHPARRFRAFHFDQIASATKYVRSRINCVSSPSTVPSAPSICAGVYE